jgi:DNA-binding transcriptional LysR family regulator
MSLTLRQLEVFLTAAQDCNFHRTAQRLGVSQPSVSTRIKSIETYLGYDLFDRSSGISPRLTLEGRSFVDKARQLMRDATQLASSRRVNSSGTPLRLKVLIGPWLLNQRVMPALPAFCCEHPEIAVDFELLGLATFGKDVVSGGEADILLYTGDAPEGADVDMEIIATTGCSIYGAPELVATIDPTIEGIAAAPFIVPPEHHHSARWLRMRLAAVGIAPTHIVARPQFPDHVLQMMLQGRGLSVYFDEFVRDKPLRRIGPPLAPGSRLMVMGPRARRPAATPLLEFLRSVSLPSSA